MERKYRQSAARVILLPAADHVTVISMTKVIIIGGGFAGVETYQRLHTILHPAVKNNVRIELISRTNFFTFTPMLHEAATGSVSREHVVQPLREILACCGQDFHQATVTRFDLENKKVETDRGVYPFDVLVIAVGVEQGFFGVPGAAENALALKWLPGAIAIRNRIIRSFENASEMQDRHNLEATRELLHFIIVGGGATGTELAGQISDLISFEMKQFYGDVPNGMSRLTLIHAGSRLLEQFSEKAAAKAHQRLAALGVDILLNQRVMEVRPGAVVLSSGEIIAANNIFWTAGTESTLQGMLPPQVLNGQNLVKVEPTFQVEGFPDVFALGDCAAVNDPKHTFPPLAQAAVQAAKVVAKNIKAHLQQRPLTYATFTYKGDIIPLGNWYGIFELRPYLRLSGRLAWLIRRAIFLQTMYGWGNRVQVAFDWIIAMFVPRDTSEF